MSDFEAFVGAQGPGLTRYAYLLCGDIGTAEDLTQTAFLKMYSRWVQVSGLDDPLAYVRRVITREYLSLRRKKVSSEVPLASPAAHRSEAIPDAAEDVVVRDELWNGLRQLPKKQRTAVILRYYMDLSHAEVAAILGCSVGTARSHTSRGLATLRGATWQRQEEVPDDAPRR